MGSERAAFLGKRKQKETFMSEFTGIRGRVWFKALTGLEKPMPGDPASVLVGDAFIGNENARFLCVVPDPDSRFLCAHHGEVGLEQAYTLAARIWEIIKVDKDNKKRPIIAIVDVKRQAYAGGRSSPGSTLPGPQPQTHTLLPDSPVILLSRLSWDKQSRVDSSPTATKRTGFSPLAITKC
jgi:hypothetical protein